MVIVGVLTVLVLLLTCALVIVALQLRSARGGVFFLSGEVYADDDAEAEFDDEDSAEDEG